MASARRFRRSRNRELIYLIAPAGFPNFGDEFIARTWLRALARTHPNTPVVLDCHTAGHASALLHHAHPDLTVVDTSWRIIDGLRREPIVAASEHVQRIVATPGIEPRLVDGIRLMRNATTVHILGGGYLNAIWPHHQLLLSIATAIRAESGATLAATGQGLLPSPDRPALDLIRTAMRHFDVFDVRDSQSRDLLTLPGSTSRASFTGDDAWLGIHDPDVFDPRAPAASRRFMFVVQSDLIDNPSAHGDFDDLYRHLAELIERWHITGDDAAFVEGIPGQDRTMFDRLASMLPGADLVPFSAVWQHGLPARSDQVWISTRFHFHLLAAAAGASGVTIAGRDDYYPTKHQSLIDLGSGWIPMSQTGEQPPHTGGFSADVRSAQYTAKTALLRQIYPAVGIRRFRR
ncbi:polysaccharide pyruvyl transferase family protein [Jongsikchunia kroppenstedtii]|uniref:polysaccharide pyruvyl transferase family protein n=1 Tax=Jongsikchunia kroppenstedtii TaxID=1121721 RepID=UPI00037AC22C|nr:polysaccharide pyruvyl transferase family protein [Jongsikchunia kroppenstedtii]